VGKHCIVQLCLSVCGNPAILLLQLEQQDHGGQLQWAESFLCSIVRVCLWQLNSKEGDRS